MDGLIKGLLDVALGGADNDGDRRRGDEYGSGGDRDRDERTRSTWAQVVSSGEHDEHGEATASPHRHGRQQLLQQHQKQQSNYEPAPSAWGREQVESYEQAGSGGGGSDGEWQTVGDKHDKAQKVPVDNFHGYKRPPSEQEYHNDTNYGSNIEPSHEELSDLSKACSKLWELDLNRLVPGKDYEIDCGGGKKTYHKEDMASRNLFSWLSDDVFRRPTFSRFCSLLDNYNPDQGIKEVVTTQEKHEQTAFIEEISRTAPFKYLHKYLVAKGIASESSEEFKKMMTGLWFDLYGRGGSYGSSSAFEHVFVGEIKDKGEREVSGFHNWIQFYLEEAKGSVDYQGYIFPRRRGNSPDSETQLLTIQFEWSGVLKSLSSTLIGVSPEFEVALYTLCFFMGGEDNHVYLGPYSVNIKCHRFGNNNNKIGSIYPIAEC